MAQFITQSEKIEVVPAEARVCWLYGDSETGSLSFTSGHSEVIVKLTYEQYKEVVRRMTSTLKEWQKNKLTTMREALAETEKEAEASK